MKATFKHLFCFHLTPCNSKHLFSMCIVRLRERKSSPAESSLEALVGNGLRRSQQCALAAHPGGSSSNGTSLEHREERFVGKGKTLYLVTLGLASLSKDTNTQNCRPLENVSCHTFRAGYPKFQPPKQEPNFVFGHKNISSLEVNNVRYNFWRSDKLPICGHRYTGVYLTLPLRCLSTELSLKNLSL